MSWQRAEFERRQAERLDSHAKAVDLAEDQSAFEAQRDGQTDEFDEDGEDDTLPFIEPDDTREAGDDDGQEYGDPRDEREDRLFWS